MELLLRLLRVSGRGRDDEEDPPFLAGLALGALVGAAIAGSTIWRRVRRHRGPHADGPEGPATD